MDTHNHQSCRQLLDALEALTIDDSDEIERIIAAHLATCPVCAGEERRLGELIAGYTMAETNLPPGLESRLLNRLCPPN